MKNSSFEGVVKYQQIRLINILNYHQINFSIISVQIINFYAQSWSMLHHYHCMNLNINLLLNIFFFQKKN